MAGAAFALREACAGDVEEVRACYVRAWRAAYADLDPDVLDAAAARRAAFDWSVPIRSPTSCVLVAIATDGAALGVVEADEAPPPPGDGPEISRLYVDPVAWGSGVGDALLAAATAWIGERGHDEARLEVVEVHHRARRFYERAGWELDVARAPRRGEFGALLAYRRRLTR